MKKGEMNEGENAGDYTKNGECLLVERRAEENNKDWFLVCLFV